MNELFPKQTYTGVSIDFLEDGSRLINYVSLVKKKNGFVIEELKSNLSSFDQFKEEFKKSPSVYLIINGKGIIHKKIATELIKEDIHSANLVPYVFPNVEQKDFYAQFHQQDEFVYISVCRKILIDELLNELETFACYPSQLFLGPFALESIIEFIDANAVVETNTNRLSFNDSKVDKIDKVEITDDKEYVFETEHVKSTALLAYSVAVLNGLDITQESGHLDLVESNRNSIKFNIKFRKYLIVSSFLLCGILLLNFFAFSYLFNKVETNSSIVSSNKKANSLQKKLNEDYRIRKTFIVNKNWDNNIHVANYIEDIASIAPKGMKLLSMAYQKENVKKSRVDKIPIFDYSTIDVNGIVQNSNQLNQWIKKINDYPYMKDLKLLDYKASMSNNYVFTLKIYLYD